MKKLFYSFCLLAIGFGFVACDGEDPSPTFSLDAVQALLTPADGSSFVFTEDTQEDAFETITWSAAQLSPSNLPDVSYRLELDFAGNDFGSAQILTTTKGLSYETTVGDLNNLLVARSNLFGLDTTVNVELRVAGFIDGADGVEPFYSNVSSMELSLFKADDTPSGEPVYLLGSATDAGWDNTAAIPMYPVDGQDGVYEVVTNLIGGEQWKVIETLGMWAPQWGSDETGTPESGGLSLRPTEADPDPMPVIAPDMTGSYKITVDLINLTYTVVPFGDIWIVGPATTAGWDNTLVIPFSKVDEGQYTLTIELVGGEQWKILDELGMWAPQWGSDETGTPEAGGLAYRPTEADPDPMPIIAPDVGGLYKIDVDIVNLTYTVTPE